MTATRLTLALLAVTTGCAIGPDHERPAPPAASSLAPVASASDATRLVRFTGQAPVDRWWETFQDPALDGLIERAREHGPGDLADAIDGYDERRAALEREAAATAAQARVEALAQEQYAGGLVDDLVVLDAQRAHLERRAALLRARRDVLGERVRLHKALGGGWTEVLGPTEG